MENHDIKKVFPTLYAPKAGGWHIVDVPELQFLMADGEGDPNVVPAYPEAVQALYTLSYAVRAIAKRTLSRVHTVGPLEGLWRASDPGAFVRREKTSWQWTMMISQPDWITAEIFEEATGQVQKKGVSGVERVRRESFAEGLSAQMLHVGAYDDEAPALARLHDEFMPSEGLTFNGDHHEVYLSDPRRVAPEKLRTVLRQPVAPLAGRTSEADDASVCRAEEGRSGADGPKPQG